MATIDYRQTGIVTAPVSVKGVADLIGAGSYDVGKVCTCDKINKFAKHKPYDYYGIDSPWLSTTGENFLKANQWGVRLGYIYADDVWNVKDDGIKERLLWKRTLVPEGGQSSPYRLGDFRGYNHNAVCPLSFGGNFGKGMNVIGNRISVHNININSVSDNLVVTLQDIDLGSSYAALNNWYLGLAFYYADGGSIGQFAYIVTDYNTIGADNMSNQSRIYNITQLEGGTYCMFLILSPIRYSTTDSDGFSIGSTAVPSHHRIVIPEDGFRYAIISKENSLMGEIIYCSGNLWYKVKSTNASAYINENVYQYTIFLNNGSVQIQPDSNHWDSDLDDTYSMRRLVISPSVNGQGFFGWKPEYDNTYCQYDVNTQSGRTQGLDRYIHICKWDDAEDINFTINFLLCWHNEGYEYIDDKNLVVYYKRQFVVVRDSVIQSRYDIDNDNVYVYYTYDENDGWQISECNASILSEISIANEDSNTIRYIIDGATRTISIPSSNRMYFHPQSELVFGGQIEFNGGGTISFPSGNIKYLYTVDSQK